MNALTDHAPTDTAALERLLERLDANPWDAEARFDLGIRLTRLGDAERGSRHLNQALRHAPQGILRLLQDPELESVRRRPEVERVLRAHHREHTRRAYTAYS